MTTYPRVDTTFLSDDIYPKVPATLRGLVDYTELTAPLLQEAKLPKSKKVFDNSKVTDHHAIIPTGVPARGLTDNERKVYDLVARRFIAAFYPDCEISTTTVIPPASRSSSRDGASSSAPTRKTRRPSRPTTRRGYCPNSPKGRADRTSPS